MYMYIRKGCQSVRIYPDTQDFQLSYFWQMRIFQTVSL